MRIALAAPAMPATDPITWNPGARRGAQHLPTDTTIEVRGFRRSLSSGGAYEFQGGIAQALQGVEVLVERGGPIDPGEVLARIGRQLAQMPSAALEHLRQIIVYRTQDVSYDRFWERRYGIPGFQAVAAGGGGQVTFFGGSPYTDGVLFHEVGHNLPVSSSAWRDAQRADDRTIAELASRGTLRPVEFEHVPDEARRLRWTPRLAPGGITPYAHGRMGEDISEALRMLMSERHRGHAFAQLVDAQGGVRELRFSEAYPERTRILELASGADLDGDGDIGR
jgi:hypothetical protein